MATLFISDLHLHESRPRLTALFREFMRDAAPGAESLYILGDLFEVWVGDDDPNCEYRSVVEELRRLSDSGVPLFVMHGNRDFLLGEQFTADAGAQLLPEPSIIDLYGSPALLLHGDSLCTDDREHQAFRAQVRREEWQRGFLSQPLEERIDMARYARSVSREKTSHKSKAIMDVSPEAVVDTMREHEVTLLIHGHTHRPAVHELEIDDTPAQRIVLGDWHDDRGSVLVCDEDGCRLQDYPANRSEAATG